MEKCCLGGFTIDERFRKIIHPCLATAVYRKAQKEQTFITAYGEAVKKQMKMRKYEQTFAESHIKYVLWKLKEEKSAFLESYPEVKQTKYLGWPTFNLFKEGDVMAIGHLYRYLFLVRMMSQTEEYAVRNFPFSLSTYSHALTWFARLPKQSVSSWNNLMEAFVARFHDYIVRVTPEQIQALRPLESETIPEFILRWIDTCLHQYQLRPEVEMVRECIQAMRDYFVPTSSVPPSTFRELLKQAQERTTPDMMDTSCNMVNIAPVEEEGREAKIETSMAVLRSGKHTAEEKGKAPQQLPQPEQPKTQAPPNKLEEEMKKLPKNVEYDVVAHLRRIPARLSIYEALQLSKEAREALINALVN